jgi:glycine cleavage system aminomethyltransferase T
VTSAAVSPAVGRPIALGYVHRDFTEPGTKATVVSDQREMESVVTRLPFVDLS